MNYDPNEPRVWRPQPAGESGKRWTEALAKEKKAKKSKLLEKALNKRK